MATPQENVAYFDALIAELAQNGRGITEYEVEGRRVRRATFADLHAERERWQRLADAEGSRGSRRTFVDFR